MGYFLSSFTIYLYLLHKRELSHLQKNQAHPKISQPLYENDGEKVLITSNKESEECWHDFHDFGLFSYWNGPKVELYQLVDWLQDLCGLQVSISHYSDRSIFFLCENAELKQEFLRISKCLFKGYVIKFFDWIPYYREDNLDLSISTWFVLNSFPLELNLISIFRCISRAVGDLIGLEATFESCSNLKLLIKKNVNNSNPKHLELITNRSTYDLNFQKYEGRISEIIRLEDDKSSSFRFLPRTSNLDLYLSKVYKRLLCSKWEKHISGK